MNRISSGSNWPRGKRSAFTLIELIVVVGMLVLLIGLLFPALNKARRQSRIVTCLTNLRELHLAYSTYTSRESNIRLDPSHQNYWLNVLQPALPDVAGILSCPEASVSSFGWGDAKSAWGPFDAAHGSPASINFVGKNSSGYGFNGWLYELPEAPSPHDTWRRMRSADRIPVFGDANFVEGFPHRDDPFPSDVTRGANADEPQMGRFCIARHGQSINAAFLDGHAEQVPLNGLWELRWLERKPAESIADFSSADPGALPSR